MLDYRYLKAFILTAHHASFSKAAMELRIAQSAISRQIKLLEQSLGQELIIRSSKKVVLTEKGRALLTAAQNFETNTKSILHNHSTQNIKIGVLQGVLENWLQHTIKLYYQHYNHNMTIKIGPPRELKLLLQEGQLDLLFTNENIQGELISSLKLFDEKLILISKQKLDLEDIYQYRWIIYGSDDHLLQTYRKKSAHIIQVDDISTIVQLVREGVGIAVVPDHVVVTPEEFCIKQFTQLRKSEIYLATLNFQKMPKYLKELVQIVTDSNHRDPKIPPNLDRGTEAFTVCKTPFHIERHKQHIQ